MSTMMRYGKKSDYGIRILPVLLAILPAAGPGRAASLPVVWQRNLRVENNIPLDARGSSWLDMELCDVRGDSVPEIVASFTHPDGSRILVIDGRTGGVLASAPLVAKGFSNFVVVPDPESGSGQVIAGLQDGSLSFHDLAAGALLDTLDHGVRIRRLAYGDVSGDGRADLVVADQKNGIGAYDGRTNALLWMIEAPATVHNIMIDDVDQDGHPDVVAGTDAGILAVEGTTGTGKWRHEADERHAMGLLKGSNGVTTIGSARGPMGRVIFAGTVFGDVLRIDGRTGDVLARRKADAGYLTALSTGDLDGDGAPDVVTVSTDHKVRAFDGLQLAQLWEFRTDDEIYGPPALGDLDGDGDLDVVVVGDDDTAYGLDGRSGQELWRYDFGTDCQAGYAILGDCNGDGQVEVILGGTRNGDLTVLGTSVSCAAGRIVWPRKWGNARNTGAAGER